MNLRQVYAKRVAEAFSEYLRAKDRADKARKEEEVAAILLKAELGAYDRLRAEIDAAKAGA